MIAGWGCGAEQRDGPAWAGVLGGVVEEGRGGQTCVPTPVRARGGARDGGAGAVQVGFSAVIRGGGWTPVVCLLSGREGFSTTTTLPAHADVSARRYRQHHNTTSALANRG